MLSPVTTQLTPLKMTFKKIHIKMETYHQQITEISKTISCKSV